MYANLSFGRPNYMCSKIDKQYPNFSRIVPTFDSHFRYNEFDVNILALWMLLGIPIKISKNIKF